MNWYLYLNQGKVWYPDDSPGMNIEDMAVSHRINAADWLVRKSPKIEPVYSIREIQWLMGGMGGRVRHMNTGQPADMMPGGEIAQDAFESMMDERQRHPQRWMHQTELYKALMRFNKS